jgi:glycosyltransferase involved in cell wall biosynthesis
MTITHPGMIWLAWTFPSSSPLLFGAMSVVALAIAYLILFVVEKLISTKIRHAMQALLPDFEAHSLHNKTASLAVVLQLESYARVAYAIEAELLKNAHFDAVHIHDHVCLLAAGSIKEKLDVPIVWDAHEIYEDLAASDDSRAQANQLIVANQQRHISAFITINQSIADFYLENYPLLTSATIVMNATEPTPLPPSDGRLHAAAGLPHSQKILLFQGGFGPHRGLHALVSAAQDLPSDWTVVLMGWGGLEADLWALAHDPSASSNLPRTVFLPGVPYNELQAWSSGASLGAILYENTSLNHLYCTPNKLWEYPNAGVPILATDLVEMGRIVRDHAIGFLIQRNFVAQDIVLAIKSLTDEDLTTARRHCLDFALVQNWSLYEPELRSVYDRLDLLR